MSKTEQIIKQTENYSANNYHPLPVVIDKGEGGVWVYDLEGKQYLDMLSAYSALSHGHRHPKIIQALVAQANKVTITSRAFHNEKMGPLSTETLHPSWVREGLTHEHWDGSGGNGNQGSPQVGGK